MNEWDEWESIWGKPEYEEFSERFNSDQGY